MTSFDGLAHAEARAFAARRLPAWTGNDPERLAGFHAEDAVYLDPAVPQGVRGRPEILSYFRRLLGRNPEWVWTSTAVRPLEGGFLDYRHASIPAARGIVECGGVCTVTLREGLITRNEVFFDRSGLLSAMAP
ncbi:nuclear transport factor 2 family protein [Streptomyces hoynatensis]|uniref:Nuclear transport factor 2 family protein n=1 Tax=Streptomyces hoynatensis TaxID=1141874 RepID=A0A3A9Z9K5_9ACTN|nr:nuclear transport factor 2 family protein [Streptomyces hoynatensis]RKN45041.1 nuclear transport factor 2 family protein [Streptomyces hoynatensis]